jgi:endonuclease/exonuclease/phosphatase family metal-dependent hydrolase
VSTDAEQPALRVATWNVRGCIGIDGRRSEARVASVIAALDVDVIGLQELDLNRRRSAGTDQAGLLAEALGWSRFFHPAMRRAEEQYGDAILSRHPMRLLQAEMLPGEAPWYCRETRAALWVDVATPLGTLHVINTHFGLGRSERLAQAALLAGPQWIGRLPASEPAVVLGDFNSTVSSPPYAMLARAMRDARNFLPRSPALRTYPTRWPVLGVDHIFVNAVLRVESVEVVRTGLARAASDHFPLRATVRRNAPPATR